MSTLVSTIKWGIGLTTFFVVGPIAGRATGALRSASGSAEVSLLRSDSPALGLAAGLLAIAIAAAVAILGARLLSTRFGFGVASLTLAWAAWRTGTVPGVVRDAATHGSSARAVMISFALEALVVGAAGLLLAWALYRVGRPSEGFKDATPAKPAGAVGVLSLATLAVFVAAVVGGAAGAWFVGVEPLKGQAIAAAVAAGIAAGFAAEGAATAFKRSAHPVLVMGAMALLGVLSPLAAAFLYGTRLDAMIYSGRIPPFAVALPLDHLAGTLLGVPLGLTWARSLMEKSASELPIPARA
ncbi:MAG: hypothetical protein FJ255_04855 [Phycisphaerae bacterium]|nr:hypothetical protein [Phycisphaerae bacterium]